ncbi:hypothetical protein JW930_01015, partial [Candidatus Woesearchaeota archaeon]|nr:hypothetical protein [Candidatus Woesearchaeota archaeon]
LTLLLGFVHLFDVITLALCFGFYMLWRFFTKRDTLTDILKYNIFYALVSLPAFIYTFYLYGMNPYFQAWNAQNILDAPKLHHLLFGYFFPLIFALVYSVNRIKAKKANDIEVILFSWMFSGLILLYSPLNIQRRFLEGLNIPIMLLGSLGFMRVVLPFFQKEIHKLTNLNKKTLSLVLIILTLILISPTSFYWLYKVSTSVRQDVPVSDYSVPYYLEKEEVEALNWLKSNTDKEAVVISGYGIGNYVPRISGNRVFLGHWAQTIDYEEKKTQVNMFYSTSDDNYRRVLLEQYNIKYVYYGIEEQKLGTLNSHYLEKVFENSKINIYALI